jgi:hypothetical protein
MKPDQGAIEKNDPLVPKKPLTWSAWRSGLKKWLDEIQGILIQLALLAILIIELVKFVWAHL